MKRKSLAILAMLPVAIFAQSGQFLIKGKIASQNVPTKIYLANVGANQLIPADSVIIKDGVFEFKGQVAEPRRVTLVADWKGVGLKQIMKLRSFDFCNVYLEKGQITVFTSDSLFKASVGGSPINNDYQEFKNVYYPLVSKQNEIDTEYRNASEEKKNSKEFNEDLDRRFNALAEQKINVQSDFIKSHSNSIFSIDVLKSLVNPMADFNVVEPLFNSLSADIRNSAAGKKLDENIKKFKQLAIGAVAPDFTQPDVDGKPVKLSDFRGKYVLLDFWASWCVPCRKENPNVVKAYNQYKDKNFTVLGISLDNASSKAAWLNAVKVDNLTWNHASDLKGFNNVAARLYFIESIPQNFLISPEGKIIAKNLRGDDLINMLNQTLK